MHPCEYAEPMIKQRNGSLMIKRMEMHATQKMLLLDASSCTVEKAGPLCNNVKLVMLLSYKKTKI